MLAVDSIVDSIIVSKFSATFLKHKCAKRYLQLLTVDSVWQTALYSTTYPIYSIE
jgi:hypothetical protein